MWIDYPRVKPIRGYRCRPAAPDLETAGSRVAGSPEADYSYFLTPFKLASQPNLKQSVFGFAGRTNSGNLGDTFAFGVGAPQRIFYDNYIVGGAYQRDFYQFNSGVLIGAEVGLADRFGNYRICCDTVAYSNGVMHSAELWGGVSFDTKASHCLIWFGFRRALCLD